MTIAVRLSNGATVVPLKLASGETVVESATVHAAAAFAVLDPGTAQFTIQGRPRTEKATKFLHFARLTEVAELPATVATEAAMDELRGQWDNVDAFYRRVTDETVVTLPAARTLDLADMRVVEVDSAAIPSDAAGWTVSPEFLGIPSPLSAMVPGTLAGVPDLIASRLKGMGSRTCVAHPRFRDAHMDLTVEFTVAFSDARTRMVKQDPFNNRRNAKRIKVADTGYVKLHTEVPVAVSANSLDAAHAEVDRIVAGIQAQIEDPVTVCAQCSGQGLLLSPGITERKLR